MCNKIKFFLYFQITYIFFKLLVKIVESTIVDPL